MHLRARREEGIRPSKSAVPPLKAALRNSSHSLKRIRPFILELPPPLSLLCVAEAWLAVVFRVTSALEMVIGRGPRRAGGSSASNIIRK